MLNVNLEMYKKDYTVEEKKALKESFERIQEYFQRTIFFKNPARRVVSYQIQHTTYSKTHLVVDCNEEKVYLTRGGHGNGKPLFHFTNDDRESQNDGWKYETCVAIIEHWNEIRDDIEKLFGERQSVLELCELFNSRHLQA